MTRVAVVGASGFVGTAVKTALLAGGHEVVSVRAPRLQPRVTDVVQLQALGARIVDDSTSLVEELRGCETVVNAAGDPDASSSDRTRLFGANALLPAVLAEAARRAGVARLVHVSSSVVQGDSAVLDDAPARVGFSVYSRSKSAGEAVLETSTDRPSIVLYRPPSVHSSDRRVSRLTARIARSAAASVAGNGDRPSPQALVDNVGSAVAFLATCVQMPPVRVSHPSEGLTTGDVMRLLGAGHEPRHVPVSIARAFVVLLRAGATLLAPLAPHVRRVEILWFGQEQAASWLSGAGWDPPAGRDAWVALGRTLRRPGTRLRSR